MMAVMPFKGRHGRESKVASDGIYERHNGYEGWYYESMMDTSRQRPLSSVMAVDVL